MEWLRHAPYHLSHRGFRVRFAKAWNFLSGTTPRNCDPAEDAHPSREAAARPGGTDQAHTLSPPVDPIQESTESGLDHDAIVPWLLQTSLQEGRLWDQLQWLIEGRLRPHTPRPNALITNLLKFQGRSGPSSHLPGQLPSGHSILEIAQLL